MRSFDLSPLFRYSVGFDRLDDLFETAFRGTQETSYPPYNIVKTGQDAYRITLAVAGFGEDELELVVKENLLTVRGKGAEAGCGPADDLPASRDRAAGVRASLPARRPCQGQRREPGERPARHRAGARAAGIGQKPQKIAIGQAAAKPKVIEGERSVKAA